MKRLRHISCASLVALLLLLLLLAACGHEGSGHRETKASQQGTDCLLAQFTKEPDATPKCTRSCEGGDAESCTVLGTMYERGHLVQADAAKAVTLFARGCDLGDAKGCYEAGAKSKARDLPSAVTRFERACAASNKTLTNEHRRDACFVSGEAYRTGEGATKDEAKAVPLLKAACAAGRMEACDRFKLKLEK